jgi:hypothetical protein
MPAPKQFGSKVQATLPPDLSPILDKAGIKQVQKIVGSTLYYAQAVNMTVLMALSSIAAKQTIATARMLERCTQKLDYLAHNANAKARFPASDMIMKGLAKRTLSQIVAFKLNIFVFMCEKGP